MANQTKETKKLPVIAVLGGGTMGCGIALAAALSGHDVLIYEASTKAKDALRGNLTRMIESRVKKGAVTEPQARAALGKVKPVDALKDLRPAAIAIEAISEDLESKRKLLAELETQVSERCLIGTNTSSLSITALASALRIPQRMVGIHFFNPALVMPLVEIIRGVLSAPEAVSAATELVEGWGKTPVLVSDSPGFIVNRIARPFYGEALRILEENLSDVSTIDWAVRELGGFRMGPFELMDFIGNDVNFATTESVFKAFYYDPRYKPSLAQKRLIQAGRFGRKTGGGFYDYGSKGETPEPKKDNELGQAIVSRILTMLIVEAADALMSGVATVEAIDLALEKGMNFPRGPLRWADQIGILNVQKQLQSLYEEYREDRYRPSRLISQMAREGRTFYS